MPPRESGVIWILGAPGPRDVVTSKILYVCESNPTRGATASGQRTAAIWAALSKLGNVQTLVVEPDPDEASSLVNHDPGMVIIPALASRTMFRGLRGLGVRAARVSALAGAFMGDRRSSTLRDQIASSIDLAGFDLIVCRYLRIAARTGLLGHPKLIVDLDDITGDALRSRLETGDGSRLEQALLRVSVWALDHHLMRNVRLLGSIAVSRSQDVGRLPVPVCTWVPNCPGVALRGRPQLPPDPDSLVITTIGVGTWLPFLDGVDWFLANVWTRIRRTHPECTFQIMGRRIPERKRDAWSWHAGVVVLGEVEDVVPWYASTSFTIACNRAGGGTLSKVLESLYLGRTAVITRHAHRGYETTLPHGDCLLVGDDGKELARHCVTLLDDPALRRQLAESGRQRVIDHFGPEAVAAAVDRWVAMSRVTTT